MRKSLETKTQNSKNNGVTTYVNNGVTTYVNLVTPNIQTKHSARTKIPITTCHLFAVCFKIDVLGDTFKKLFE